jgi:glycosyltransferase involved in cell wall biosynthesis
MKKVTIYIENILNSAGTERAVINLANNLYKNGNDVTILSLYSSSGFPFFELSPGVKINHLDIKFFNSVLKRGLFSIISLAKIFKSIQNDNRIVIGTVHSVNVFLSLIKLFKGKNKYLGCEHIDYDAASVLTKIMRKLFYPFLDSIIVLTKNDYDKYISRDILKKCNIIPNEISFYPVESPLYSNKRIIAIGRYTEQKGFDILIDDIKEVLLNNPDWNLSIIGDGEMRRELEEKINNNNLDKQVFLKPFTKNIEELYLDASIYIMTSRFEGLPMVLLEAKACGLPIISYDCPSGPKEIIIEGEDGFLVPFQNKQELSQKLILLINSLELRERMGRNAKKNSLSFSSENIYSKWLKLFNSL